MLRLHILSLTPLEQAMLHEFECQIQVCVRHKYIEFLNAFHVFGGSLETHISIPRSGYTTEISVKKQELQENKVIATHETSIKCFIRKGNFKSFVKKHYNNLLKMRITLPSSSKQ